MTYRIARSNARLATQEQGVMVAENQWGVLVTQNQRHRVVKEALKNEGFEYFLPLIETASVQRGRHVRTYHPLLGRYVLVALTDLWQRMLKLRGVAGMMFTYELESEYPTPALVSQTEIEYLRAQCVNNVYRATDEKVRGGFVYGQRVRPKEGPLEWHVGLYDGYAGKKKYAALFNIFGREQRVVFSKGDLIAA